MTDTPVEEATVTEGDATPSEPVPDACRWCGAYHEAIPGEDWLCPECERYQDAMVCPVCGSLARVSAMPAEMVPAPAAPAAPKKGKK